MIFGDTFLGWDTRISPLGTVWTPVFRGWSHYVDVQRVRMSTRGCDGGSARWSRACLGASGDLSAECAFPAPVTHTRGRHFSGEAPLSFGVLVTNAGGRQAAQRILFGTAGHFVHQNFGGAGHPPRTPVSRGTDENHFCSPLVRRFEPNMASCCMGAGSLKRRRRRSR